MLYVDKIWHVASSFNLQHKGSTIAHFTSLPDWCFYITLYNEPYGSLFDTYCNVLLCCYDRFTVSAVICQRSCLIMSSFDYGQTALLRFVVDLL